MRVVQLGGLEPPTSGSTIRRSNQLSYSCTRLVWRSRIRNSPNRAAGSDASFGFGALTSGRTLGTTPVFGKSCVVPVAPRASRVDVDKEKARATGPGSNKRREAGLKRRADQATFFIALPTPA